MMCKCIHANLIQWHIMNIVFLCQHRYGWLMMFILAGLQNTRSDYNLHSDFVSPSYFSTLGFIHNYLLKIYYDDML